MTPSMSVCGNNYCMVLRGSCASSLKCWLEIFEGLSFPTEGFSTFFDRMVILFVERWDGAVGERSFDSGNPVKSPVLEELSSRIHTSFKTYLLHLRFRKAGTLSGTVTCKGYGRTRKSTARIQTDLYGSYKAGIVYIHLYLVLFSS